MDEEQLYAHITSALVRDLPLIGQHYEHDGVAVLVGSGPSVEGQVESIKAQRALGRPIVALKDAHDWLQDHGIVPDYAAAIDPQDNQWKCFQKKHPDIKYFIASQCHPSLFDHLSDMQVFLWHLYIAKGQSIPPHGTALIAGGTTTGLRTISLLYSMGYRQFELYGYDSCLKDGVLRRSGWQPTSLNEQINEIVVDGKMFYCNPAMTSQANEFQNLYIVMPDIEIASHGDGLITSIIAARKKQKKSTISFIHRGGDKMASYRYRAAIPANELGASINDESADILYIAKPIGVEPDEVLKWKDHGKRVIMDFCDDHFHVPQYQTLLSLADAVSCPTAVMASKIEKMGYAATVIEDPYEFDECEPHCHGSNLLWFGHGVNYSSIKRIKPDLKEYDLRIVSNIPGSIPWSMETMRQEFQRADIVVIPKTEDYKSANRAVEAIRQGCFVVAEPHPALDDIPGIWLGNIKDGIEWASQHQNEANQRTKQAQMALLERFSPRTQAFAMSRIIQASSCTWEAENATGKTAGSI